MNPEKNILENEQIENEEQAIGEPLSPDDEAQLELDKRMAEADEREDDLNNGWTPGV